MSNAVVMNGGATDATDSLRPESWLIFGAEAVEAWKVFCRWYPTFDVLLADSVDLWCYGNPLQSGRHALQRMGEEREMLSRERARQLAERGGCEVEALINGEADLGLLDLASPSQLPGLLIITPGVATDGPATPSWDLLSLREGWDCSRRHGGLLFESLHAALKKSTHWRQRGSNASQHGFSAEEVCWDLRLNLEQELANARSRSRQVIPCEENDGAPVVVSPVECRTGRKEHASELAGDSIVEQPTLTEGERVVYEQNLSVIKIFPKADGFPTRAFRLLCKNSDGNIDPSGETAWVRTMGRVRTKLGLSKRRLRCETAESKSVARLSQH